MPDMSEKDLLELIKRRLTGSNHDVYVRKAGDQYFTDRPTSVYFYYMKYGADGFEYIRHYFYNNGKYPIKDPYLYPGEDDEIRDIIRELALNAVDDDTVPPSIGQQFKPPTKWRKKSYIVILMHNDDYTFCKESDGKKAILFNPGGIKLPNHSFFDGRDMVIDVSPGGNYGETATAICFINHMKRSENWDDLDGNRETQYFKFTLCFDVASKPGQPHYYDPDGTNMGPPQSPP